MADEDTPAEPVGRPSPAAPSPAAPASETKTEIDAVIPAETHINARVSPRRISTPSRRAIGVYGIVIRHVPGIRVGRLNVDDRLTALALRGDGLLGSGTKRSFGLGFGPHMLHGRHHVG